MRGMSSTDYRNEQPCYEMYYDGIDFYQTITLRASPNCSECGKPIDGYWERWYSRFPIEIPFNIERWKRSNENLKANLKREGRLPEADTSGLDL